VATPELARLPSAAPLAQWQSSGLLIQRFGVRIPGGAPDFELRFTTPSPLKPQQLRLLQQSGEGSCVAAAVTDGSRELYLIVWRG
jgi:hypothetical protein